MMSLVKEYAEYGIIISELSDDPFDEIYIESSIKEIPIINAQVVIADPVMMLSFTSPSNGDGEESSTWSDSIESNSQRQITNDATKELINNDAMSQIRANLIDDNARKTFDIFSQTGSTWIEFTAIWGDQASKRLNISKFLNVPLSDVNMYASEIQELCIEYGLIIQR